MEMENSKPVKAKKKRGGLRKVLGVLMIMLVIGILGYAALIGHVCYVEANVAAPSDYDAIIVLGAQVLPTGEPSVQLRWRLDKAKEMYEKSPCPIVCCGAKGKDEPACEGDVMRELLISEGIPEDMVIPETKSGDTHANIENAARLLSEKDPAIKSPLIVTSDYHLPRAIAIAKDLGVNAQGAGSPCRPEIGFWLKNHMREALAWVKYWGNKYLGLNL